MSTLTSRIDALPQELQSLSQEALQNEEARKKLYGVVQHSAGTLESPMDFIWRMIMTVSSNPARNLSNELVRADTEFTSPINPPPLCPLSRPDC